MMEIISELIIKKHPDAIEQRAFLIQHLWYVDKRDSLDVSLSLENYFLEHCPGKDVFSYILNELDESEINSLLDRFNISTEYIYYFKSDKKVSGHLPTIFRDITAVSLLDTGIIVMEEIKDANYYIYNVNGEDITEQFLYPAQERELIECSRIVSVKIGEANKILIKTGGRYENWFLYQYDTNNLNLLDFSIQLDVGFRSAPEDFLERDTSSDKERFFS